MEGTDAGTPPPYHWEKFKGADISSKCWQACKQSRREQAPCSGLKSQVHLTSAPACRHAWDATAGRHQHWYLLESNGQS